MRQKITAVFALVLMIFGPSVLAAQGQAISVNAVDCAATSVHPRVTANVPASAVTAQVFFKAEGTVNEYYVDMRKAADGTMWAYLPAPAAGTRSFTYHVITLDAAGKRSSSPVMTVNTSASCPQVGVTSNERAAAAAIVVGLTSNSEPAVPTGFECRDIVSYITVEGVMKNHDECRRLMAGAMPGATTAGETATAEGAGLSRGTIIALTAAGLVGAGVAIYQNNQDENKPVSPSRP